MAVSGSGGWIPAASVAVECDGLRIVGCMHNMPRETISTIEDAIEKLVGGKRMVAIDTRKDNFSKMVRMWEERKNDY